jgi:hypothetical protein
LTAEKLLLLLAAAALSREKKKKRVHSPPLTTAKIKREYGTCYTSDHQGLKL